MYGRTSKKAYLRTAFEEKWAVYKYFTNYIHGYNKNSKINLHIIRKEDAILIQSIPDSEEARETIELFLKNLQAIIKENP